MTITDTLTASEFDHLFDAFSTSVVRLETLPAYAVGGAEADRLAAFRTGQTRPLRNVVTDPWLARIALTSISGKRWHRVRVVDDPMTDYQRYQLDSYRESQAAGEVVTLARRGDVGALGPDFWLFDRRHVVLMHYHPDGRLDRREHTTDPDVIDTCSAAVARVAAHAHPLNEFLAARRG